MHLYPSERNKVNQIRNVAFHPYWVVFTCLPPEKVYWPLAWSVGHECRGRNLTYTKTKIFELVHEMVSV